MVSIKDVAKQAGVSPQTVSNVLNAPQRVRPQTQKGVEAAIDQLGYLPNASARRLRKQRSGTIAVGISPNPHSAVYDRFLHALAGGADAADIRITLYKTDSHEDEIRHFTALCAGADVDAFVLTDTTHQDPRPDWLIRHRQTFVMFGRPWGSPCVLDPEIAWVDVDGRAGIREMTQHLILTGHRHIGLIGWPEESGTGDDRMRGWRDALLQARLADEHSLSALRIEAVDDIGAGQSACVELLDRQPDIDALVCVSDTLATGAMMASPDGLAITGFDNTPTAQSLGFSSIEQNMPDIAHEILRIIDEKLRLAAHSDVAPETVHWHSLLKPTLAIR
ncbi:LacI family DNA-binding transcriptional regulator [Bifidobacterium sp.]|jgi:DNA-binding LacI/PurR family transcriptional regulator|uniref:LacI family DNA-binding transcriptional regulator n=1 Tax=Bifidobacterium sp. TaxID=41200 RepID=UPI0025BD6F2B|nr:LacI family DNA-binding transcriptional regulator [Bifidobacterium sp.]MCH4208918.1 LacI family transcriptional regulator [Bifidobacterium sp.]MCI1224465.1 LacI family transcriptional regulator [Bifidobacterium sp.]